MATSTRVIGALTFAVILGNVLCVDLTNSETSQRPWQSRNNNKNPTSLGQVLLGQQSTTPWPALGQGPRQKTSRSPNIAITNTKNQQPMWVRPNGGTNWVRNTPPPPSKPSQSLVPNTDMQGKNWVRNTHPPSKPNQSLIRNTDMQGKNINLNTDFINREKGGNPFWENGMRQGVPTQAPMMPPSPATIATNSNSSYANILGNTHQGIYIPKTVMNNPVSLPTVVSTGSSLTNRDMVDTVSTGPNLGNNNNGDVDDNELREFAEEIYNKDINNPSKYVTIKLQGTTTSRSSRDEAPEPLLTISQEVYRIPSVSKMIQLYNNYILQANENEVYTAQEKLEENDLIDTVLSTPVMQHTRNFLVKKGKVGKDPKEFKDILRLIWFQMYSRGGGRIGSSGFEHVFLAELKNNKVSGLHNWLYFNEEEKKNNANYLGYMKKVDLGSKGAILKYHFTFHNVDKPVGSMFIGTSPELEMALYSTCFIMRADRICPLKMNGQRFIIRTYTYRYRGKNMIGSAFPEI